MNQLMIEKIEEGVYVASSRCMCGRVTSAEVSGESLFRWNNGAFAQDAFPYVSADDREAIFVSGICARCWDDMFGSCDDDDFLSDLPSWSDD